MYMKVINMLVHSSPEILNIKVHSEHYPPVSDPKVEVAS